MGLKDYIVKVMGPNKQLVKVKVNDRGNALKKQTVVERGTAVAQV